MQTNFSIQFETFKKTYGDIDFENGEFLHCMIHNANFGSFESAFKFFCEEEESILLVCDENGNFKNNKYFEL